MRKYQPHVGDDGYKWQNHHFNLYSFFPRYPPHITQTTPMIKQSILHRPWYCVGLAVTLSVCGLAAHGKTAETPPMRVGDRLILTEEDVAGLKQDQLIHMMGTDLPWSRIAAARALADRGATSIPIFQQALADSDWRVARAGIDGLMTVLATADKDQDETLRQAVIATIPDVRKALKNKHYFVRMGALKLLGKLGPDAKDAATDACDLFTDEDFLGVAPTAIKTVAAIGVEYVDPKVLMESLAQAIRSRNMSVRGAAVSVVAKLDETRRRKLIPDMINALQSPMKDGYTRFHLQARIANQLYDLGENEALPLSIAILSQKGWGKSHRVSQFVPILEKYGPDAVSALPLLEKFLKGSKAAKDRAMLEEAIAKIKGEKK